MAANKETHKGHRQRMRERAIREGLDAFNPHQVMELLLFYAVPRQDVSELAHMLVDRFGSVRSVLNADSKELMEVKGVGKSVAEWLKRVGMLVESYGALGAKDRPIILNYATVFEFCRRRWKNTPSSYLICTTPSGIMQIYEKLCDSLSWGDPLVLRQAMNTMLAVRAKLVIIVEYVPDAKPKAEEYECKHAEQYAQILKLLDVTLLDVILVGSEENHSLRKHHEFQYDVIENQKTVLSERYLREEVQLPDYENDLPLYDNGI